MTARPRVYLNQIANLDWLIALEFGRVDDTQPPENWRGISEQLGVLHDGPDGPAVGFKLLHASQFDIDDPAVAEIWGEPRFYVPALGLPEASIGEIILATRALYGSGNSINRDLFSQATQAEGEEALWLWLAVLGSGDSMAHFALGYTLYDLGRFPEAYRHLRHYTEISPCGSWNWCWLGRAAEAVGEPGEARRAYRRAIELAGEDADAETEARELLCGMDERGDEAA